MNQHLETLFANFRAASQTEREKGTYFEELIKAYLRFEPRYQDLYSDVWTYAEWAKHHGASAKDSGIDLVARTRATNEYHAIQCKFYDDNYTVQKKDIDSFFTASGKKTFAHRIIVASTNNWSEHAEDALEGQNPPVTKIDLHELTQSHIDWSQFVPKKAPILKAKKELRPHQQKALKDVEAGLKNADRGKLIMACGTGKTFTALKIAERIAGKNKRVLFLVPSLSLLSQTLNEWTQESNIPLHSFAVCSDSDVGKKRKSDDDTIQTFIHELRYPATTDASSLAREVAERHDSAHMTVVFSTYQSIDVISKAQKKHGFKSFDLIVCDEAHRTTGATFENEQESDFVKIHDNNFIKGAKRVYMTATPRIYADSAQAKAEVQNITLASMDNESIYGKELHVLSFSEAVMRGLLVDYKVIVLTVDEAHVSKRLQKLLSDEDNQLKVDDAAKIIGCWKALSKQYQEDITEDIDPMRRAVAFCQVIEPPKGARVHKVSSKQIASMFQAVVQAYQEKDENLDALICEASHIDGSMNASEKEDKLDWLKERAKDNTCRILTNVRCLSEGVDVPALDAVLFLTPRNSQVDVVQSVGRIMRNAPGKSRGYVILPVVVPAGVEPHQALNDNKTYKVVWDVLQALRSHDDRFDAMINKFDLVGKDHKKMEVIAITDKIQPKQKHQNSNQDQGKGSYSIGIQDERTPATEQVQLEFEIGEIERALYAKMVQKCGNRRHWEEWAQDIAKIAKTHITRINTIVSDPKNKKEVKAFNEFANELRDDLNDQITDAEVVEMLAQHLITKPVFDALFDKYSFASNNPVSVAMQKALDVLQQHKLDKETDTLEKFYNSVKLRAEKIDDASAKQKIVVELYDKFFRNAFPKMTEKLGIVYTPVEVVDFIIHSVNKILGSEFNQTLGSEGVHIVDPFTGTGTFITRLMQSGLISSEQLRHKYQHEIHANEIVLLAYYIAAINIEAVYHGINGGNYLPFEGICLTDTFQLYEKDDLFSHLMVDNSERRKRQKALDIRVIIGNPPYSVGQKSENDNAQNVEYPALDQRIGETYVRASTATLKTSLYDSYIRAFRWATDRVGDRGVIGFVTNGSWIDGNATDGMRKCLIEEFSNIYVFHLRGNQRTQGELSRKEGGKIFGGGSRAPIAITILVKNPNATSFGNIYYHDIGDYLSREQKLAMIGNLKSIEGITNSSGWEKIIPDKHNDWLRQRDDSFDQYISLGDKKDDSAITIFETYSGGVKTNRDAWCFNFSRQKLESNIKRMVSTYNNEVERAKKKNFESEDEINKFVLTDPSKISWSSKLKSIFSAHRKVSYASGKVVQSLYRPYTLSWLYQSTELNDRVGKAQQFFPQTDLSNITMTITGVGSKSDFSALVSAFVPCYDAIEKGQGFPLFIYEGVDQKAKGLFDDNETENGYRKRSGITDAALGHFKSAYPTISLKKEDIFYYVYGILHSIDYRMKYADTLTKQLPRIPCVKEVRDFHSFVEAGRALAKLHIEYENVKPYDVVLDTAGKKIQSLTEKEYFVTKMRFSKKEDKSTIVYNDHITIKQIPIQAYDYVINGKPAIEWVMERQSVKTDKESSITNDANAYAIETVGDPSYPLTLLRRIITVSLETLKIVQALPKLKV